MMSTSSDRSKNRRFPFSFLWSITSSSFSLFVGRIGNGWFGWKAIFPKAGWISLFFTSKYQLHSYSTLISYYEKEKKKQTLFFFFLSCASFFAFMDYCPGYWLNFRSYYYRKEIDRFLWQEAKGGEWKKVESEKCGRSRVTWVLGFL